MEIHKIFTRFANLEVVFRVGFFAGLKLREFLN